MMSRSEFLSGKCPECGSKVTIFSHVATKVTCENCGALLAEPTGGKSKIHIQVTSSSSRYYGRRAKRKTKNKSETTPE